MHDALVAPTMNFLHLSLFSGLPPCLFLKSSTNKKKTMYALLSRWQCQHYWAFATTQNTTVSVMWQETERHKNMFVHTATHIFIGGLVEGDQVCMEASQSHYRPEGEETHQHFHNSRKDS